MVQDREEIAFLCRKSAEDYKSDSSARFQIVKQELLAKILTLQESFERQVDERAPRVVAIISDRVTTAHTTLMSENSPTKAYNPQKQLRFD
jgi:hypothetical protein